MSIKFKNFVWIYSFILGIFLVSNAHAWPEGKSCFGPEEKEGMKEKVEACFKEVPKELNLTPEQEEQLKRHKTQSRERMKELREKISSKREELGKELQRQELDMEKINQFNTELKVMNSEMQDDRLKCVLEVREILSPEQYTKFKEFIGKHRNGMKGHGKGPRHMKKGSE
ncbi:MAG: Spy/CpxP family protein refolding chaperone [Candidatus Omnitrophica bacterium]|nr:Spy/CpxP family protein refolding chaperone [Candidatus Omnitrophota bacterium]